MAGWTPMVGLGAKLGPFGVPGVYDATLSVVDHRKYARLGAIEPREKTSASDLLANLARRRSGWPYRAYGLVLVGSADGGHEWLQPPLVDDLHTLSGSHVAIAPFVGSGEQRSEWLESGVIPYQRQAVQESVDLLRRLGYPTSVMPCFFFVDTADPYHDALVPIRGLRVSDVQRIFDLYYGANQLLFDLEAEHRAAQTHARWRQLDRQISTEVYKPLTQCLRRTVASVRFRHFTSTVSRADALAGVLRRVVGL